ncbi:unnamed protein product [Umbelopsis ramanniana]
MVNSNQSPLRNDNAVELDMLLGFMKELIIPYVDSASDKEASVVEFYPPEKLEKLVDFSLPENAGGVEGAFKSIKETLKYSVNGWNPRFMDKLYAGTNPIGVISELLIATLNSNVHVYHVSPVLTMMEIHVTRAVGQLLGMGANAGGLLCPGGSASNQLAMVTARNTLYPSIKDTGYMPRPFNPAAEYGKLKIFTSKHSHYSIDKSAQVMGLGVDNIVKVPVDEDGKMQVSALEKSILESIELGETPFFINATAGTTVMGAFDPIEEISAIAKKYNCWLHVDGSWGGSVVFSEKVMKEKSWLVGSHLADTFTMNPHKLLGVPLQCSMLLTPHDGNLLFAKHNTLKADYLFHGNPYDLGEGTLGCGRRPDAAKIFLSWKYYGRCGLGDRVDQALATAEKFAYRVKERESKGFKLVKDPCPFLQVCFWYVPPALTNKPADQVDLSKITRTLHKKINHSGEFMIDYAPLEGIPDFFRIVINAPTVDCDRDLVRLLDVVERVAKEVDWEN